MTLDDAFKAIASAMITALSSVAAWLAHRVVADREEIIKLQGKVDHLESVTLLTLEDVRDAIDEALDRRDKAHEERRREWDRRLSLEIRAAVREVCDGCKQPRHLPADLRPPVSG